MQQHHHVAMVATLCGSVLLHDLVEEFRCSVQVHRPVARLPNSYIARHELDDARHHTVGIGKVALYSAGDDVLHLALQPLKSQPLLFVECFQIVGSALRRGVLDIAENNAVKVTGEAESRVKESLVLGEKNQQPTTPSVGKRRPVVGEEEGEHIVEVHHSRVRFGFLG